MTSRSMEKSSPTATTAAEVHKFSYSGPKDVPIRSVVVFSKNKAEITRVLHFVSATTVGLHEVEVTGLPAVGVIKEQGVAVKGSGHCTIRDVSLENDVVDKKTTAAAEGKSMSAELKEVEDEIDVLRDEQSVLLQEMTRTQQMRQLADRVADRVTSTLPLVRGGEDSTSSGQGLVDIGAVDKVVEWWAEKAEKTDKDVHRQGQEGVKVIEAINKLVAKSNKIKQAEKSKEEEARMPKSKVVIGLDVEQLGPIDLEVKYILFGASWTPAYELRVDSMTDSMSCIYYGLVLQFTCEDWEDVSLSLSTAEPGVRETPPTLGTQTLTFKNRPDTGFVFGAAPVQAAGGLFGGPQAEGLFASQPVGFGAPQPAVFGAPQPAGFGAPQPAGFGAPQPAGFGAPQPAGFGAPQPAGFGAPQGDQQQLSTSPQPPAPKAKLAVAQVEGGGGDIGALSFSVGQRVKLKSNAQEKKLVIGVLKLSTDVTHLIVPSKEPAAYLQAEATNTTDYQLLASEEVSIFVDNNFVTKTALGLVSPGESFRTCLGTDPAIKIKFTSFRKVNEKSIYGTAVKETTFEHSTSISNKKKVPVTCVVLDVVPRSADDNIKVSVVQPECGSIGSSAAHSDEALVSEALDLFGGGVEGGKREEKGDDDDDEKPSAPSKSKRDRKRTTYCGMETQVTGVLRSDATGHLAWVVKIGAQDEIQIPLEYTVERPASKEIDTTESG